MDSPQQTKTQSKRAKPMTDVQSTAAHGERRVSQTTHRSDLSALVAAASAGDCRAWASLVDRYSPLVHRITCQYRLSHFDAQDVYQTVWMRVFEYLGRIREPRALPGWISTVTRNAALHVLTSHRRTYLVSGLSDTDFDSGNRSADVDDNLLRAERRQAIHEGLAVLEPEHRELLLLLHAEPPISYREISTRLGMPTGSIGPTRARCLQKLRATAAIRTLVSDHNDQDRAERLA